jgi:CheY-like chemotaxis protein
MRILFIEDEVAAVRGLEAILVANGHEVDIATTGDEAVTWLTRQDYDLILLDVMIEPGNILNGVPKREGGVELLLRLRRGSLGTLKTKATVPVVAITAVADLDINTALRGGDVVKILQKPIDPADTFKEINGLIQGSAGPEHIKRDSEKQL